MSSELEERVMQEYLNHRRSFSRQQDYYIQEIDKAFNDLPIKFELYPLARRFLIEQKTRWHESRILSLRQIGINMGYYESAEFFLKMLYAENQKQERLLDALKSWLDQSKLILCGVQRIKINENDTNKLLYQMPIGITLEDDKIIELNHPPDLNSFESPFPASPYGRISEIDKQFLTYYRRKTECLWNIQAGLWPYMYEPIELWSNEPIEGSACEVFYTGVSDLMLSMIKLIAGTESVIRKHTPIRVS